MAKIKIKFTEDMISLIKCLRFELINNGFYVENNDSNVDIRNNNGNKFILVDNKKKETYTFNIKNKRNYGDNIYGFDTYDLYGGTFLWEQMALILGKQDDIIVGTESDPMGPKYKEETMEYFKELDNFIVTNIKDIEEILHQFCTEGIQPNVTYWCMDYAHIWYKE